MADLRPRIGAAYLWRQILIGLGLFACYLAVDSLSSTARQLAADRHGHDMWRLEHRLHLDAVTPLNDWLAGRGWLQTVANYEYAFMYLLTALAAIVWLLWRHPEAWPRARTSFVLVNLGGIACFWLYPVTPPRLLPGTPFTDTVATGRTWGSWGSSVVAGANQLAAMPSLHFAWALWVSVALASVAASRRLQLVSGLHVLLTLFVIVATANHYVLDAVAAAVVVLLAELVARRVHDPAVVGSADAFFLHVERTGAPQTVGGLVLLDRIPGESGGPSLAAVRELLRGELPRLPRFTQRVTTGRWRRPRWVAAPELDWDWHVCEVAVSDRQGVDRVVGDLTEQPLPQDRPLWRFVLIRSPEASAVLLLVHHAVADGIGTVIQALNLLRPRVGLPEPPAPPAALKTAAGTVLGIGQLALDGGVSEPLGPTGPCRDFATDRVPLAELKATGHRVTDVLLAATAGALADLGSPLGRLRVAVPLMVRTPGAGAEGNVTAAVMVDVPCRAVPTADLLAELRTSRLHSPTRALASRFVMARLIRVLPEPAMAWFARTVYGGRFFHAIVSNMPGPAARLTLAGAPMAEVYPVLPLAPGVPVVLGGLSWDGVLGLGLATAPETYDARAVLDAMRRRLNELRAGRAPVTSAATSPARGGAAAAHAARAADPRTALGDASDGS